MKTKKKWYEYLWLAELLYWVLGLCNILFAFGFIGVMMTSTILGLITMVLFRSRSWCVYCPMGTMTQGICMLKHRQFHSDKN